MLIETNLRNKFIQNGHALVSGSKELAVDFDATTSQDAVERADKNLEQNE